MTWMQTYTGKRFNLLNPKASDIDIVDIAHALSRICRFTGHCEHYSVAQHSVIVSQHVAGGNALAGLMHDAHEAYVGDVSSPMKRAIVERMLEAGGTYDTSIETDIIIAIRDRFCIGSVDGQSVKQADLRALMTEARDIMGGQRGGDWGVDAIPLPIRIVPWSANRAKEEFLKRTAELCNVV